MPRARHYAPAPVGRQIDSAPRSGVSQMRRSAVLCVRMGRSRMRLLRISGVFVVTLAVGGFTAQSLVGQSSAPAAGKAAAGKTAAGKSTAPRTAWGKPDLEGTWDFRTVTPMERPAEFKDKPTLTPQEEADYAKKQVESRNADTRKDKTKRGIVNGTAETEDVALAYNDFWWDRGTKVIGTRRTSLIIDPPDGRFPPMTDAAKQRMADGAKRGMPDDQAKARRRAEGPEDRSIGERCIMGFNSGPPMVPGGYNQNVQIVQHPHYVALLNEMVHNARIIPLDGKSRSNLRQWVGEPVAHWDGDTLVIESKNFQKNTSLRGSTPNMRLTER